MGPEREARTQSLKLENDLEQHDGITSSPAGLERCRERKRLEKQSPEKGGCIDPAKDFEIYFIREKKRGGRRLEGVAGGLLWLFICIFLL